MSLFTFFSWILAAVVTVTGLWPLNVPLAALAYKVQRGDRPIPLEPLAFWWRSAFAALGLAGLTLVLLGLNWLLVHRAGFPPGMIHLILLMAYIPAGVGYVFWIYALDDLGEALSIFVLYLFLPGLPLLLVNWLFPSWHLLALAVRRLRLPPS